MNTFICQQRQKYKTDKQMDMDNMDKKQKKPV